MPELDNELVDLEVRDLESLAHAVEFRYGVGVRVCRPAPGGQFLVMVGSVRGDPREYDEIRANVVVCGIGRDVHEDADCGAACLASVGVDGVRVIVAVYGRIYGPYPYVRWLGP